MTSRPPSPIDLGRLSSLHSTVGELSREVTALANQLASAKRDDAATRMYEAERGLTSAVRKLEQVMGML